MGYSKPGFPTHHQLSEIAQIHIHWVCDVIQPSHSLLSPSPGFNLSQGQGLFQRVSFYIMYIKYWNYWVCTLMNMCYISWYFNLEHDSRILRTCSGADVSQLESILYSTRATSQRLHSKPSPHDYQTSVVEQTCCDYRAGTQACILPLNLSFQQLNATTEFVLCST